MLKSSSSVTVAWARRGFPITSLTVSRSRTTSPFLPPTGLTHWPLKHDKKKASAEREIWLWDFAGQVDYRLVHQLFMDDTAAAVLVFNPQNENPFEGLGHWDRDLQKAARKPFAKLLAAARVDVGGLVVSAASMKKFMGGTWLPRSAA